MPATAQLFAPSLAPNSILSICVPSHLAPESSSDLIQVKQFDFGEYDGASGVVGLVRRIAIGKGKGRASEQDVQSEENDWLVVADSTNRITLSRVPPAPSSEAYADDTPKTRTLKVEAQYKVEGIRKADRWVGLEVLPSGILSTLSSGIVTLHPFPSISASGSTSTSTASQTLTARLPSPLTCLQSIPPSTSSSIESPTHLVAAGKEVDVGVWDMDSLFQRGSTITGKDVVMKGEKRKKGELGDGQVWGAKNLPNNSLSLRTPVHHLSLAILPSSTSTDTDVLVPGLPHMRIITGTQNGHIRSYDTRQRKPTSSYKMGTEGGIGVVHPGRAEHEVFYAEGSALFGAMDLRTGRTMYKYATGSTSSAQALMTMPPAPEKLIGGKRSKVKEVGLVSIGSDATMRFCSTGGLPKETKGNVLKGEILAIVGAIGVGNVVFGGWHETAKPTLEVKSDEEGGGADDVEGADVWDDLELIEGGEEDGASEDGSDDDDGEDDFRAKRRKQEGRS